MNGHHLILGELNDFITGASIKDTHDERYRQKIARLLINRRGYLKSDIEPRKKLLVQAGDKRAIVKIDFLINLSSRICMIVKYGPGSLVTRRRPVLAASRIAAPYQIPVAVVTNGEDAEILEGSSGQVFAVGLESIPSRLELENIAARNDFKAIPSWRVAMEARIVYCYEVDDSCPCDENICKL
ncbi:MAG: type I restriction enzyme HsdR N-terminal domain-containing protein [Desulfobacterales bacterium]|nr:MAG: type I restriction enzyme HsdR N-terminal domain-containing protein [Desulfobacterales bacterium]